MKRIVSLWFMIGLMMSTLPSLSAKDSTIFYANNTEIEIIEDSPTAKKVQFSGSANFEVILGDDNTLIGVNGAAYHQENYILYGYQNENLIDTAYDGFIVFYNELGEETFRHVFDLGEQEEFIGLYNLNDTLIYHLRQSITNENGDHVHEKDYFIRFDEDHEHYDFTRFKEQMIRVDIIEDYIYLSHKHHGDYHVAFNKDFDVLYDGVLYGAVNYGTYFNQIDLTLLNGGYLNEEYINKDISVDYPGYYVVNYKDNIYTFVLHPLVEGIKANDIRNEPVTLFVSNGYLLLNDDLFINETTIDEPGHYTLTIEGVNDYVLEIPFTITSNLEGIYHNQRYFEAKTITFNGLAYLNNRLIESPHKIEESGVYTLTIFGENNYQETHQFEVEIDESKETLKETLMYVEISLIALALTGILVLFIKLKKQA